MQQEGKLTGIDFAHGEVLVKLCLPEILMPSGRLSKRRDGVYKSLRCPDVPRNLAGLGSIVQMGARRAFVSSTVYQHALREPINREPA
jgi:hypothetical protein